MSLPLPSPRVLVLASAAGCGQPAVPGFFPPEPGHALVIEVADHPVWFEGTTSTLFLDPASPDEATVADIRRLLEVYPEALVRDLVDRIDVGTALSRTGSDQSFHGYFVCDEDPRTRRMFLSVDQLTTPGKLASTVHHEMGHSVFCSLSREERAVWSALRRAHLLQDTAVWQASTVLSQWANLRTTEEFARYTSLVVLGRLALADAACMDSIVAGKASFVTNVLKSRGVEIANNADVTCSAEM
jgi:hypothetical protein